MLSVASCVQVCLSLFARVQVQFLVRSNGNDIDILIDLVFLEQPSDVVGSAASFRGRWRLGVGGASADLPVVR